MITNEWRRSSDEIIELCNDLLRPGALDLAPTERLILLLRVLTENHCPLSRPNVCAMIRIGKETYAEINRTLERRGLVEYETAPGKATTARTTFPADVTKKIIDALNAKREAESNPAFQGRGAAETPPSQGGVPAADPAFPRRGMDDPASSRRGMDDDPAFPRRGADPDPAFPRRGAAEPRLPKAGSEPVHITTRAHDARADHHRLTSLEKEESKKVRAVSVERAQPSMFAPAEMAEGCHVNGKAITWLDPTNGSPQSLTFRLLESSISSDPGADPVALREWARREIDLAIAEGKDGNLSRWLRHLFPKSWPKFMAGRSEPEKLSAFKPARRISDKLEPWEG